MKYAYTKEYHEDCVLLVAPIVALIACRFYMKFFGGFSMASVLHAREIGLCFGKWRTTDSV